MVPNPQAEGIVEEEGLRPADGELSDLASDLPALRNSLPGWAGYRAFALRKHSPSVAVS